MPHDVDPGSAANLADALLHQMAANRAHAEEDPFGNPVLATALAINRQIDEESLTEPVLEQIIQHLRDRAAAARARRLAEYVGGPDTEAAAATYADVARRLIRPDPEDSPVPFSAYRDALQRIRFAAVFTAHPTFALARPVFQALARAAAEGVPIPPMASHRPTRPTLADEFDQANGAIAHARDALDRFTRALLDSAREIWPERWPELVPRPIVVASWVGYDTDGRTDIGWWDTLRYRLIMKRLQLERLHRQVDGIASAEPLAQRVAIAIAAVETQIAAAPPGGDPDATQAFAAALVGGHDSALLDAETLLPMFAEAIERARDEERMALAVARAGLVAHGLSFAHTHVRLNSSQLHNAARLRLGLENPPADRSRRRVLLGAINSALDEVRPVALDFGALLAEQASATRLMMVVAQIAKHVDAATPIRFLIAETETGYTLLCALWLARLFGIDHLIEISPLFETEEALQQGARVLEEAIRSPHFRDYLRRTGRLALQFGYSDSGRYVGQLAASYLIERLRMKVASLLAENKLDDVELILFDTHGESIGRGAHPGSLLDRLRYLSPPMARQALAQQGITVREESAFQGGDGYLLFDTPPLAHAAIARIARHAFPSLRSETDKIYSEADFAADFFASVAVSMHELVEDPGYASLLGAFGPALLDSTGSRPAARQADGVGGAKIIRHPRELRAIPNNAILQQLGWCANTLQGLGHAAARQPELFTEMRLESARFGRALDFASHALAHSDLDVLRAVIALLDPGSWLDRAQHARRPGRARGLSEVARTLEQLDLWAPAQALFRRIQHDHLQLREAWPDAPVMSDEEMLLHALRIALIGRIWLLSTEIPEFSPRHGVTREALGLQLLQLDVPSALDLLGRVFPVAADPSIDRDFGEPRGPRAAMSYGREHETIFRPIGRLFAMVREIGTAVSHHIGAFG